MLNGKDTAGNEVIVQKKVLSLDLDKPNTPIITASSQYATIKLEGVLVDSSAKITYDTRTDIDNYYSIDNGTTWLTYTGQFNITTGTIIAKSIKKSTGLEASVTQTVSMPADAIRPQAYDGNDSTYSPVFTGYIKIDQSVIGKNIRIKASEAGSYRYAQFLDVNKNVLASYSTYGAEGDKLRMIPNGAVWLYFQGNYVYEVQLATEPTFSVISSEYALLHIDPTKQEKAPYQMVSINYMPKDVQRLYRIGLTGEWLNYNDQPIKVLQGQTIYAKGIDQYGIESRIISSYTPNITDAIDGKAFDENFSSYSSVTVGYIKIDQSVIGRKVRIKATEVGTYRYVFFYDKNKTEIARYSTYGTESDATRTIPSGAVWMYFSGNNVYEVQLTNEPLISLGERNYSLISVDPLKRENSPFQFVTLDYSPRDVQRLYRIGTIGDWLSYNNQPVKVLQGQTIYAKGIDENGVESKAIASITINITDAIDSKAFDGNLSTYSSVMTGYAKIDPDAIGKGLRIVASEAGSYRYVYFQNASKTNIVSYSTYGTEGDKIRIIPSGTVWIYFSGNYVYELQIQP